MVSNIVLVFFLVLAFTPYTRAADECIGAKFSGGEHKQLGEAGFLKACNDANLGFKCSDFKLPRADRQFMYSYGDLITAGDFFSDPLEAYNDDTPKRRLARVFRCIEKEGHALHEQKTNPSADLPGCGFLIFTNIKGFLKLASSNDDHFVWSGTKAYVKYHEMALSLALEARKKNDSRLFEKALFINGVADHYLTDAFAAGHVRMARKQVREWTKKNISSTLKHYVSDAFAMLFHDHDGKDRQGEEVGLEVANANGDIWVTHSDSKLNICREDSDPSIRIPIDAVAASVGEVIEAYYSGHTPSGYFTALWLIPFATVYDPLPAYKLNGNSAHDNRVLRDLQRDLPLPLRMILTKKRLKKLLQNMPAFWSQFIVDVERDVASQPDLARRLPPPYVQGLTKR